MPTTRGTSQHEALARKESIVPGQSMKRIEALRLAGVTVKADIDAPLEVAARETIPTLTWVHCGRLSLATDDAYEWAMEHEEEINVWRAVLHDLWCADWIKAPKEVAVPDKPILVTTLPDGAVVQGPRKPLPTRTRWQNLGRFRFVLRCWTMQRRRK